MSILEMYWGYIWTKSKKAKKQHVYVVGGDKKIKERCKVNSAIIQLKLLTASAMITVLVKGYLGLGFFDRGAWSDWLLSVVIELSVFIVSVLKRKEKKKEGYNHVNKRQ